MELERVKRMGREVLDLFFPRRCFYTGEPMEGDSKWLNFNQKMAKFQPFIEDPRCETCGVGFHGEVKGVRRCPNCVGLDPIFSRGISAFMLKGAGRKLVHELKYHKAHHLWPDVGKLAAEAPGYLDFIEGAILVPVPLHKRKLRARGFNQSLLLAKALAKRGRDVKVQEALKRVKMTQTQTYLTKEARRQNVKNAFAIEPKSVINKDSKYIIVDDVFTTGATLNECSMILNQSGVETIHVLTLGHG